MLKTLLENILSCFSVNFGEKKGLLFLFFFSKKEKVITFVILK